MSAGEYRITKIVFVIDECASMIREAKDDYKYQIDSRSFQYNINRKKIKESLTKGFVLLTLTGTLVSKNPINSYKEKIVYASVDLNLIQK